MNRNNGMSIKTKIKKKNEPREIARILFLTIILIFVACGIFGSMISSAQGSRKEEPTNYTYYKSIVIQEGDTLWTIAEQYITEDYESVSDYVKALMTMNQLYTDQIHYGQNLMVVYNDTNFY